MKKIFLGMLLLTLIFSMGCNKDLDILTEGAGVAVHSNGATELDNNVTFNLTVNNNKCTQLTVTGATTGTISIADGKGTFSATTTALGLLAADSSATLTFTANTEGNPTNSYSVTMTNPISITSPDDVIQDDEVQKVYYTVSTVSANVSSVKIETKVNSGVYSDVSGTFSTSKDSLSIKGSDYNVNDTVYFKVTATAGSLSSTKESSFVVGTYAFANTESGTLDFDGKGFDFIDAVNVPEGTDTTDVKIQSGVGTMGFMSTNGTQFVVSDSATFAGNDIVVTKAAFAAGTPVSLIANVSKDDVYIFKTTRSVDTKTVTYYGIIKISDFILTSGDNKDGFTFDYVY